MVQFIYEKLKGLQLTDDGITLFVILNVSLNYF